VAHPKTDLINHSDNRDIVGFIDAALSLSASQLPSLNVASTRLVLTLMRVSDALKYDLEAAVQRPAGLSSPGFHLLWILWLIGASEASVAASLMGVSRATISGISSTLEKSGFISRERSQKDGRSILLNLTPSGRRSFEEIFEKTNERYVGWSNNLTAEEVQTLVSLLAKFADLGDDAKRRK
jgi:DNA-binding MarR family transcriptional regulator